MLKWREITAALFVVAFLYPMLADAEILVIPGSGAPEYVLGELAKVYNNQQTQHKVLVPTTTGTAGALRDVSEGKASIGRVGRPLKDSERNLGLTYHSLGRDPIAFVGGSAVSARNISRQQVIGVYSGKVTNWRDLGSKPGTIRAIGREPTDSSCQAIALDIKGFDHMPPAESVKIVHLDTQMIELLDRFPGSFGFLNRSALSAAKTELALLALDSVEPSAENVMSGRYPIWTELGLIYREAELTEAGRSFLRFIDSTQGNELLRYHGLVPVKPVR